MSYEGPAVIICGPTQNLVNVMLHVDQSGTIKSWEGSGEPVEPGFPAIWSGKSTLRLPDGREGDVYVGMTYRAGDERAQLAINGSGEPPFDF